jgi:hypothetical protein
MSVEKRISVSPISVLCDGLVVVVFGAGKHLSDEGSLGVDFLLRFDFEVFTYVAVVVCVVIGTHNISPPMYVPTVRRHF